MSQSPSPENEIYIQGQLATGVFSSREEAIDAGVAMLRQRDSLMKRLKLSREQLDRGDFGQENG